MSQVPLYRAVSASKPDGVCQRECGGDNLKCFKDLGTENGSNQGQNLALTVLFVLNSLDGGGGLVRAT